MGRAPCCEKVGLKKGRWSAEEDELLVKYIKAHGEGSWRSLPKNAGLSRCGKSCRLRWVNYLRTDLKRGNITQEEEETMIKLHASLGNRYEYVCVVVKQLHATSPTVMESQLRWSAIAEHLPGRTDNEIKNYWNSHISRKIHTFQTADGTRVTAALSGIGSGGERKGGRTRRSAMKISTTCWSKRKESHERNGGHPISFVHGKERENMAYNLDHYKTSSTELVNLNEGVAFESGLMCFNEQLSPSLFVGSGFCTNNVFEGGLFGASDESGTMNSSEERDGKDNILNDDGEGVELGSKEGRGGEVVALDWEEMMCLEVDNLLNWEGMWDGPTEDVDMFIGV